MNSDDPLPTRASLLERLKNTGDHASWTEFERTYRGLLTGVVRRAGLNEHETAEVVQDTLITLAKKIAEFQYEAGKDSFKGWLLQIVRWRIVDQVRRRSTGPAHESPSVAERLAGTDDFESGAHPISANIADPRQEFDGIWDAEWKEHLLGQALARVKRQTNPEQYAIYHLLHIDGRTVSEVRRALGVSAASVYVAKYRVGAMVRKEIARLRAE